MKATCTCLTDIQTEVVSAVYLVISPISTLYINNIMKKRENLLPHLPRMSIRYTITLLLIDPLILINILHHPILSHHLIPIITSTLLLLLLQTLVWASFLLLPLPPPPATPPLLLLPLVLLLPPPPPPPPLLLLLSHLV